MSRRTQSLARGERASGGQPQPRAQSPAIAVVQGQPATVALGQIARNRQAQAVAGGPAIELDPRRKRLLDAIGRYARAIVLDGHFDPAVGRQRRDASVAAMAQGVCRSGCPAPVAARPDAPAPRAGRRLRIPLRVPDRPGRPPAPCSSVPRSMRPASPPSRCSRSTASVMSIISSISRMSAAADCAWSGGSRSSRMRKRVSGVRRSCDSAAMCRLRLSNCCCRRRLMRLKTSAVSRTSRVPRWASSCGAG